MNWTPDEVAFSVFGIDIRWYGLLIAVALFLGILIAVKRAKKHGLSSDTILDMALWTVPISVIGGRLYYVIFQWEAQYASNPISALRIWEGGLAIYGVVIAGAITIFVFCKKRKIRFTTLGDILIPSVVLGQAIGRWGNFFNQEAYGPKVGFYDLWWFPFSVYIQEPKVAGQDPGWYMATFFYESLWCLVVFAFLVFFYTKRAKHSGNVLLMYFSLYGFERALVELLRTDQLRIFDSIPVSSVLSAILFVGATVLLIVRHKKEAPDIPPAIEPALLYELQPDEIEDAEETLEESDSDVQVDEGEVITEEKAEVEATDETEILFEEKVEEKPKETIEDDKKAQENLEKESEA